MGLSLGRFQSRLAATRTSGGTSVAAVGTVRFGRPSARTSEWFDIQVHQNIATTRHLVLPPSQLLAESELEMVAVVKGGYARVAVTTGLPRLN